MTLLKEINQSFLHLFFPHVCAGCGNDLPSARTLLCLRCISNLPETRFESFAGNPVEKIFWGRLPVVSATAGFYFNKETLVQNLMHQFKYNSQVELGFQLGYMMGEHLLRSHRFPVEALIPLPLYEPREKQRGFNQSFVLCEGMSRVLQIPVLKNVVRRSQYTESQTRKGRIERWNNMEGRFELTDPSLISGKHILLVDDVVTTGATLEACGTELLKADNTLLSIATLCIAAR
ncbi:MAG TPA: phosphoribosyltransferase family protein [Chitinophagaceae bacterium]|nr:phosphoribosyltransferase family protein [Chitinophagaceae bacterium]